MATPAKAGRKEWIGLAVIALPCVLYSMDLTVLNLALPAISEDLKPTSTQLLWIVDIYGFLVAGSLITMGTLGDRIGRRKLLMIGAAAFGAASVLAAFSNTPNMLIATRALLGVAGATLAPSTLSLIRNMFQDSTQRTLAIGVWATSYSVGGAIGPLVGGLMLQYFWWGSVFLVGVPVMVLLLILAPILLPEFRNAEAERIDLISTAMSLMAILAVVFGLKHIAQYGVEWLALVSIFAGVGIGIVFLRRQRTLTDPFLDLRLFKKLEFNAALIIYTLSVFIAFGSFFFIAQYLQLVVGLSPLQSGLWMLPSSAGFVIGSLFTPTLAKWFRPSYIIGGGLLFAACGFALITQAEAAWGLGFFVIGSVIYSLGISPSVILSTDLIIGSAPPERAGTAASLSETSAELGGAMGIAVLGSIGTAIYRGVMATAKIDVPAHVRREATETLGGAASVAEGLAPLAKGELVEASRGAFLQAFEINAIICTALAILLAVGVLVILRNVKPNRSHQNNDPSL